MRQAALGPDVVIDCSALTGIGGAPVTSITLRENTQASVTLYSIDGLEWNVAGESGTVVYT